MLKTTVASQMLVTNKMFIADKVLAANKVGGVEGDNELSEKCRNCQKLENHLSSKNRLSQKKNCQKVGIYLISTLKRTG